MIKIDLDFKEVDKMVKKAGKHSNVKKAVAVALAKVAIKMRTDVIPRTPRGTGDLMNSWRVEKQMNDDLEVGFDIIYAAYQHRGMREDGTYIIRNRPAGGETGYLKNAIDDNLQEYFDIFEATVLKELFK